MTRIDQPWLTDPATRQVCAALTIDGAAAFFVGGCVRNALLGAPVSDLDIATDAPPETVIALAKRARIKAIPTGIEHGTVTLVQSGIPFEVTTFRKDVATDGRRAVVAFSTNIAEDAQRRDFTMNALYAAPDGTVVDPLNGLKDLNARKVRFIGDATARIREDYLRSLRYFRFHAWYGDHSEGFDPEALSAIASNLDGLARLSKERVTAELLKLLSASDPAPSVAAMRQTGVLSMLLPGADDRALAPLIHLESGLAPNPLRRLAALGGSILSNELRLSKQQQGSLALMREAAESMTAVAELAFRHGMGVARDIALLRAALLEQPVSPLLEADLELGGCAAFPVSARDLMPEYAGPALGKALRQLEAEWIASGFALDRETLLSRLK